VPDKQCLLMKNLILLTLFISISIAALAQKTSNTLSLIPQPASIETGSGSFVVKNTTFIEVTSTDTGVIRVAHLFSSKLSTATGYPFAVKQRSSKASAQNAITFSLVSDSLLGKEGYTLKVSPHSIAVAAYQPAGLFYATQTLLQLLPREIESKQVVKNVIWSLPAVTITDTPRFGWRGLMFDVSRHFFTKQEVKSFIDDMVHYKYNTLHLHLSDDQGWRIEIKSYPKLTDVGAWRPKREGKWGNLKGSQPNEPKNYGGFFTQDDIKELVQYAGERFVNILPEIDIPGHSMAAIAAYPELSCTPGSYNVNSGEKFMQWHGNGTFSALVDNNICPAKESVYGFLDTVFGEIANLFPFEYIHMGGDEAAKNLWEQNDTIKALMAAQDLKNPEEVQSYFVKRIEGIIKSKGKKLMGWDEILEGGLPPEATVMSWRGMKGGIQAAKEGHHVVMSPSDFAYIDYMQGDPITEPLVYASLRLNQTYKFDPVPQGIDPSLILGGQANLWTEQIPNMRAVQYMVWPRGLAIAESVWSPKEKKDYNSFVARVENEFQRMDLRKVKYSRAMYDPIFKAAKDGGDGVKVTLDTEVPNLDIFYSFDETNPDEFYPKYTGTLTVPTDALTLKVVTYRDGKLIGRQINMPVVELRKRAGLK